LGRVLIERGGSNGTRRQGPNFDNAERGLLVAPDADTGAKTL
jgi:hypothetical protein